MLSMILVLMTAFGLTLLSAVLWALCLRLGLRWAGVTGVTTGGIVAATAIVFSFHVGLSAALFFALGLPGILPYLLIAIGWFLAIVVVPCVVIKLVSKASMLRSLQAWLPTLVAPAAALVFTVLVLRPFVFEAFVIPTNAMAPTLLGKHQEGICPECGKRNYASAAHPRLAESDEPRPMICDNFHVTEGTVHDKTVLPGDRILAAKFLTPRRWDIIVFQVPANPKILYVKRLVGLPGETIEIRDGAVWANGNKLTLPDGLSGLEYESDLSDFDPREIQGSTRNPAKLGDDEYFVLGDFSRQSNDSRMWYEGAKGHKPYAVPKSHIKGVVIETYWPLERQRTHR